MLFANHLEVRQGADPLVDGADSARQHHENVAVVDHHLLALGKVAGELAHGEQRVGTVGKHFGYYPDNLGCAVVGRALGCYVHHSGIDSAIQQGAAR